MKPPKNQKGVREFFGMVRYYRKFIRFADAARPMTRTERTLKCEWSDDCQTGFEYLKTCLTEVPILKYPNPYKRYVVFPDASCSNMQISTPSYDTVLCAQIQPLCE